MLQDEVEAALETIRPGLAPEGATVELVAVRESVACVRVRLSGPEALPDVSGLLVGIQRSLQSAIPGLRAVVNQDLLDLGYPLDQLARQMLHAPERSRDT